MMKASKELQTRLQKPSQNRSLERGILILRAFRPGADLLGNSDLAERTGLPPATVSRLTQTLVRTGLLEHDQRQRAYRLATPVLSLAHAMRSGSPVLQVAAPRMRSLAETLKINVGLATVDGDEMVYLESVRYNKKISLRNVVAGQRVPIELTSLGCAYLAVAAQLDRNELMAHFKARRRSGWQELQQQIEQSINSVHQRGYCVASWQPEVVALATPIIVKQSPVYVLNVSVATQAAPDSVAAQLSAPLLQLAQEIGNALSSSWHGAH
ncbi:MAG TPA: IclR family transcriptional regulator [Eoetvoesiella sp.]